MKSSKEVSNALEDHFSNVVISNITPGKAP